MAERPTPPPARRGYHHGNLREALLEAARHLVAERGPQAFTLVEAARRAGVSPSAPYRHFRDREEVLRTLSAQGFALFGRRLQEASSGAASPAEALRRMGPAYLAFAREEPGYYAAMFSFRPNATVDGTKEAATAAAAASDPHAQGAAEDGPFGALTRAVAGALPPAGRAGGADPRLIALQVWALSHGVAMLERAGLPAPGVGAPSTETVLASGVEALLRGGGGSGSGQG